MPPEMPRSPDRTDRIGECPIDPALRRQERFYKDILDGLALYYESSLIADIRNTALLFPRSDLGNALNKKQTACKMWLLDELHAAVGGKIGVVHILGGWYGVLAALLLNDPRFDVREAISIDIDPACEVIAGNLNATQVAAGRFRSLTGDLHAVDYSGGHSVLRQPDGETRRLTHPDLVINTSCEHLERFEDWYARLPAGMLQVLQSNDYFECDEHVNCVESLEAFRRQAPMREILFAGTLRLDRYTRFMLIGRK